MSAAKNAASKKGSLPSQPIAAPHTIVIGDGWAALAAVGFLVQELKPVVWITNTGARMFAALPTLDAGADVAGHRGIEIWHRLARGFGLDLGEATTGSFLREFRNKAFREPAWIKAPTPEGRQEVLNETLWAPERTLVPLWEARFALSLNEIEQRIRLLLTGDSEEGAVWRAQIRRVDEIPVGSFKIENDRVLGVILGSGEELLCERVIYADRWDALPRIQGLQKNLPFIRGHEPASVLQAVFGHEQAIGAGLPEGFFGALHKESGEEFERHVWGHFSSDGSQSFWSLCLTGDEVEDNHQIGKKLRRLKNALDKMFTGASWLPEGKAEFMANVAGEAVRFHEGVVFTRNENAKKNDARLGVEPMTLSSAQGLQFVTDGFGPSSALVQIARALELPAGALPVAALTQGTDSQAEGMDSESPSAS
jgi:hypothetical protein